MIKIAALTPKRVRWKRGNFKLLMAEPISALLFQMSLVIGRIFLGKNCIRDIPNLEVWLAESIQAKRVNHYSIGRASIGRAPCLGVLSFSTCGLVNQLSF